MSNQLLLILTSLILAVATAAPLRAQAPCSTNIINISTGFNPWTGAVLGVGLADPLWTVIVDPLVGTAEPHLSRTISPYAGWDPAFAGTRWISTLGSAANPVNGLYVFQRCFCVKSAVKKAHIVLDILADDSASVILNGVTIATTPANAYSTPTHVDVTVMLPAGKNCLEVNVQNTHSQAMGLDITGSITASSMVFEPDTCCHEGGSMYGRVLHDLDCDSVFDAAGPTPDTGLAGWVVTLTPGGYTTTTDATGYYTFVDITPGTYTVTETIPALWTASNPTAGTTTVTVVAGTPAEQNFLNCKKLAIAGGCPQLFDAWLDSTCCVYHVSMPASFLRKVVSVSYAVGGGVMETFTSTPCVGALTVVDPSNGTLTYSPACDDTLAFAIDAVPTTATGEVNVTLTVVLNTFGLGLDTCVYSFKYTCARPVLSKCDTLTVAPFPQENVSIDYRTFTIYNEKYPPSPICSIDIAIADGAGVPPPSGWQGGNLYFDGVLVPTGTRFILPYDRIPNAGAADLAADNVDETVAFNLGIDYTTPWTGTVTFIIKHCDGDSCVLTYGPWTPSPPSNAPLATAVAEDDRELSHYRVRVSGLTAGRKNVRWLAVSTVDANAAIVAASSPAIVSASSPSITIVNNSALFNVAFVASNAPLPDVFVVVARKKGIVAGDIRVVAYNDRAVSVASTVVATSEVEPFSITAPTPVNVEEADGFDSENAGGDDEDETSFLLSPNPASESISLSIPTQSAAVSVRIVSLTGQVVLSATLPAWAGSARGEVPVTSLAAGTYVLEYDDGVPLQRRSRIFVRD